MEKAIDRPQNLKEYTQRLLVWLWEQRLLLLLSFVLLSTYLVRYLPPQESWFIWQPLIGTVGLLLHLIPLFLESMLALLLSKLFESPYFFDNPTILIFIWDFAILYLLRRAWRRSGDDKSAIYATLLFTGIIHAVLFVSIAPFVSIGPIHSSCEVYTSEVRGVRIVAYPENRLLGNDHVFYLSTIDGGKNWEQVGYEVEGNPDTIDDEDCLEYLQENP